MWQWDEDKRQTNLAKHGVDFADMAWFDWATAATREDTRGDYGERRFVSVGLLRGRLFVCVWTHRDSANRVISLRKGNPRERRQHDQDQKLH